MTVVLFLKNRVSSSVVITTDISVNRTLSKTTYYINWHMKKQHEDNIKVYWGTQHFEVMIPKRITWLNLHCASPRKSIPHLHGKENKRRI